MESENNVSESACAGGQIFHIDFGHILNHIKIFGTKGLGGYGFVRGNEKKPFVLTKSSITVVCRGKTPTDQGLSQVKSKKKSKNSVKISVSIGGNVSLVGIDDLSSLPSGHRRPTHIIYTYKLLQVWPIGGPHPHSFLNPENFKLNSG